MEIKHMGEDVVEIQIRRRKVETLLATIQISGQWTSLKLKLILEKVSKMA